MIEIMVVVVMAGVIVEVVSEVVAVRGTPIVVVMSCVHHYHYVDCEDKLWLMVVVVVTRC